MASDDLGLVQAQQRHDNNGLNRPQLVFPNSFPPPPQRCTTAGDSGPKTTTRELTSGFIDRRGTNYFHQQPTPMDFRRGIFTSSSVATSSDVTLHDTALNWKTSVPAPASGGSESDDSFEDDDEEDGDRDDEIEVEGLVSGDNTAKSKDRNDKMKATSSSNEGVEVGVLKSNNVPPFGLKDGNSVELTGNEESNGGMTNAVTLASADQGVFYSQCLQGASGIGSSVELKVSAVVANGCSFSGRKDSVYSREPGESLRTILSDPLTGALMDDAVILPCGHSFGCGGLEHVLRMKACYTCSRAVSEDSLSPNLSLRIAIQAFRREAELLVNRSSKRRERYDQDKGTFGDSLSGHSRGRGIQFPFAVTDRVIIKGNKRTPPRFVGREAIVTTQCLNGWYVVKTLDNAESVKLQYRSLAKIQDTPSPKPISSKMPPNWF